MAGNIKPDRFKIMVGPLGAQVVKHIAEYFPFDSLVRIAEVAERVRTVTVHHRDVHSPFFHVLQECLDDLARHLSLHRSPPWDARPNILLPITRVNMIAITSTGYAPDTVPATSQTNFGCMSVVFDPTRITKIHSLVQRGADPVLPEHPKFIGEIFVDIAVHPQ